MKYLLFILCSSFVCSFTFGQSSKVVYCIPGTGADARLFQELVIENHEVVFVDYLLPEKRESFETYVERMAAQIDTTQAFSIVGVSLGGMIAVELSERLSPEETIIIASAKSKEELPTRYKIFRWLPIHRVIGGRAMKFGTKLGQPFFEPMDESHETVFKSMINQKHPYFIKSAVRWIVGWERAAAASEIIHIHGDKDHTLPVKCVAADYVLDGGHMITLTHADAVSTLLNSHLK